MKTKILLTAILFTFINVTQAQITVDHVYPNGSNPTKAFKLANSGLKYFAEHLDFNPGPTYFSVTYFVLYNPDHTIFKTINVPQIPGLRARDISYVSETLFDLDSLIEYMLYYQPASGSIWEVKVLNENGSILLDVNAANFTGSSSDDPYRGFIDQPIFPDGNQTKLYLYTNISSGNTTTTTVYNLPGQLPCLTCDNGVITGLAANPNSVVQKASSKAFPNPSREHFTIKYLLPENSKNNFLEVYDLEGNLVKKSKIKNNANEMVVYNDELSNGEYVYRIIADNKIIASNKIIVSK